MFFGWLISFLFFFFSGVGLAFAERKVYFSINEKKRSLTWKI